MGTPKGEGRSRGARSRGGDRRRDNASQVVRAPQGAAGGAQPGRVGGPLTVEEAGVIDVHGATLERVLDAGSGQSERVAREAEVAVSKSAEIAERVLQTIPQATLPGTEFPGAGSANSNYRADIVNVPPAAEPPKEGEPPRASRVSSRAHKERLEAASVLDAPASLHESVQPPAKESWVLRIWIAVMLAIIGSAGFVAWREQSARSASGPTAIPSAPEGGDPQPREPSPTQGAAGGAVPPTNAKAAAAPGPNANPPEPSSQSPKAAEAATAVSAAHAGASPEADPTPEQLAAEEQARARRAARRAPAGDPASPASVASQLRRAAAKAAEGKASADSATARAPTPPISRDPGSVSSSELQLPQNPYDADEATEAP